MLSRTCTVIRNYTNFHYLAKWKMVRIILLKSNLCSWVSHSLNNRIFGDRYSVFPLCLWQASIHYFLFLISLVAFLCCYYLQPLVSNLHFSTYKDSNPLLTATTHRISVCHFQFPTSKAIQVRLPVKPL